MPGAGVGCAPLRPAAYCGGTTHGQTEQVQLLYGRGYKRDDIMHLLKFLDWLVRLPPGLDERFEGWISEYERRKTMPYVTSFERIAMKRGRAKGLEEAIGAVLRRRFGRKGLQLLARAELPRDWIALRRLHERLLDIPSFDEAAALVAKPAARARKTS